MKFQVLNVACFIAGAGLVVLGIFMPSNGLLLVGAGSWLMGYAKKRLGDKHPGENEDA